MMRDAHALTAYQFTAQARPSPDPPACPMTVDRTDPYAALGLTPSATQGEIRRAYRTLLRQNHPDTHPLGDPAEHEASTAALQDVIAAYATLGDPASRALHDHRRNAKPSTPRSRLRPSAPMPDNAPEEPPIKAGPVRWHRSPW